MTDNLKEIIKEEVAKLPKEMQDVISGMNWVKIAEEIGVKFSLNEDEITDLQTETLLVLVGITDPEFYAINIENQVLTTKDTAGKIAKEAFEKIFTPIYKKLTENIKNNLKNKSPKPEQNLDFILSGGNYTAFMEPASEEFLPELLIAPPTLLEIQANTQKNYS